MYVLGKMNRLMAHSLKTQQTLTSLIAEKTGDLSIHQFQSTKEVRQFSPTMEERRSLVGNHHFTVAV